MRLLADLNIAPGTVSALRALGHDVTRVDDVIPPSTPDEQIVEFAPAHGFVVLTQDLDFSAIVALAEANAPSIICVRLGSARVEAVKRGLEAVLPTIEVDLLEGGYRDSGGKLHPAEVPANRIVGSSTPPPVGESGDDRCHLGCVMPPGFWTVHAANFALYSAGVR